MSCSSRGGLAVHVFALFCFLSCLPTNGVSKRKRGIQMRRIKGEVRTGWERGWGRGRRGGEPGAEGEEGVIAGGGVEGGEEEESGEDDPAEYDHVGGDEEGLSLRTLPPPRRHPQHSGLRNPRASKQSLLSLLFWSTPIYSSRSPSCPSSYPAGVAGLFWSRYLAAPSQGR